MKNTATRRWVLATLAMLGQASCEGDADTGPHVVDARTVVSLQRSACFGPCPVYSVRISGDGTVTYEGKQFVKVVGVVAAQIPVEDVQALVDAMERANYAKLSIPNYSCNLDQVESEAPSVTTSLTIAGTSHTIRHYLGNLCAPEVLRMIEDRIDVVANTAPWVKCDTLDGTCPWEVEGQ